MLRAFGWTLLFWTLFVLFNTVSDAVLFYSVFPWYKNMDLWHLLKYFWIGFAVLTGWIASDMNYYYTYRMGKYRRYAIMGFLLLWFLLLRWILHEGLMWQWRQP